ncbi:hypothetical protein SERLA73DRAFT_78391 [Serpula lacrymans var. lacrymans S7.3]|uniref:Uncharacterized protein n=1 Tax=Serpula lacrymans var. lacrymans (strain S7.3) TaxID=936435 RepID=F8QD01_SERL3|nr:hypothetical protein SERLA73DRAFT_78391 [Serpula lacrymans var. lacrymans S7.3]
MPSICLDSERQKAREVLLQGAQSHNDWLHTWKDGKQAYKLLDTEKRTVFSCRHVIFNESGKVQKDDTAPWNTDTSTDQWEGLIPENAHYPDQNTLEEDDPDPGIRDPNELQMEPHLQGDVLQVIEPYQHKDVPRAVRAPDQLRHPPQQSLQPRPEHWQSSEQKAKVESQSVGGQLLNIQLDRLSIRLASGRHTTPPRRHSTPSGVSGATHTQMCLLSGVPAQVPKRAVMPAEVLGVRRSSRQTRPADKN